MPPQFFVPTCDTIEDAEELYRAVKAFMVRQGYEPTERCIWRITYEHNGETIVAQVGLREKVVRSRLKRRVGTRMGEEVFVILETPTVFLICTPTRGVLRDMPIMAGLAGVVAEDFDGEAGGDATPPAARPGT